MCIITALYQGKRCLNLDLIHADVKKWLDSLRVKSPETINLSSKWLSNPAEQFNQIFNQDPNSGFNDCLLMLSPFAIWASRLNSNDDLFEAVRLYCAFTSTNSTIVEASYLYCFACKQFLVNGFSSQEAYEKTRIESERRAMISGFSTIKYWIENYIEGDKLIYN